MHVCLGLCGCISAANLALEVCPAGAECAKQALQGVLLLPNPAFVGAVWLFMAHLRPFPLTPVSLDSNCMCHPTRAAHTHM